MTLRIFSASILCLLFSLGCQTDEPGTGSRLAGAGQGAVAAEIDGHAITTGDLDAWIRDDLFQRETRRGNPGKLYELRSQALERLVLEQIIDAEAARRNLTREDLIAAEIEARGSVTDEEIRAFYDSNQAQMGGADYDDIAPQVLAFLQSKKSSEVIASLREAADVRVFLEPVRIEVTADGPSKGPADAPVTIIECSDFQCPFCQRAGPVIETLLEKYGDDLRFVYRHLPLDNHSRARPAAEAAVCADAQGRFWAYHDALFANNRKLGNDDLLGYATELDLDLEKFKACLEDPETGAKVSRDLAAARAAGISGTPAFLINGRLISGAKPAEEFMRVIDAELAAAGS